MAIKTLKKPIVTKLPFKNKDVIQMKYTNVKLKREDIQKYFDKYSKTLKKEGFSGKIQVTLKFDGQWRSGKFVDVGERVRIYSHDDSEEGLEDPDHFTDIRVYTLKDKKRKGGCKNAKSKTNDCFYECLQKVIPKEELPWMSAEIFKKELKVARCDKIDLDLIPEVEKHLNDYKISVIGDHIQPSVKKANKEIILMLKNEHYEMGMKLNKCRYVSFESRKLMVFEKRDDNENYRVYIGKGIHKIITEETFRKLKRNTHSSPYILYGREEIMVENKRQLLSLKETYDLFTKNADALVEESDGLINMYKTGTRARTALDLFYKMNKAIIPDQIMQDESEWINDATTGALIWGTPYKGPIYKYDFCSEYPSIMSDNKMLFPIKRGEFTILSQDDFQKKTYLSYGIYRIKISKSGDPDIDKFFRFNSTEKYTHIDFSRALTLGLKMEIIYDGKPNALIYSRERLMQGCHLFKKFVTYMFELKKKKVPWSKGILNSLWGALCQKKIWKKQVFENDKPHDIGDAVITSISPMSKKSVNISYYEQNNLYETNFGRIAPFMTAKGRFELSKIGMKYAKNVMRMHTDSIFSDIKLEEKTGDGLGMLKYEGYCNNCRILNCVKVIGEFTI